MPKHPDAPSQRTLCDSGIAPYRIQQLVFRDQPLRVVQQEQEKAKGLRLDRQRLPRLVERELLFSNLNVIEAVNKGLTGHKKSLIRPNKTLNRVKKMMIGP
jgi:hypothetical protein